MGISPAMHCYGCLPDEKILFTGDLVFNERMLGVLPDISKVKAWQATFRSMRELKPQWVIAGHGKPSDLVMPEEYWGLSRLVSD